MNAIVTAALLGTAQQQNIETYTGTPVDTVTEKLPPGETERNLLLSAGAWALYRQAGRVTDSLPQPPEPASNRNVMSNPWFVSTMHASCSG